MLGYYFDLALRSLRRNKALTALMVLAIALGIGASMTTLTVLHVLSGDPLPGKSHTLFYPQLDPRDKADYEAGEEPPRQVTWIDGMNLLHARRADRQALMTGGAVPIQPAQSSVDPFFSDARYTTANFFPMFDAPFRYGRGWSEADDDARSRVVVITSELNDKLFGGRNSTGQMLQVKDTAFRIIGVLGDWRPNPHFYDLNMGDYSGLESVFLPLSASRDLHLPLNGSRNCWGDGGSDEAHFETASCVWLQFWAQINEPAKVVDYRNFLVRYSQEQKALGRFQRSPNVRLLSLMEWLDVNRVVPNDVRLQTWLALGFLLVCLVNTVGLMLAKFLRRSDELGVRRALGASKQAVFGQLLVESAVIGLAGGVFGLLLAFVGLWLVRRQPSDYAALAHMDLTVLAATFVAAIAASLFAGLLPAWRACQITPALQLKSN